MADAVLLQIDAALMRLRRLWDVPGKVPTDTGDLVDASTVLVVDAIRRLSPGAVHVADIARQLQVSPSTASRLVSRAHQAGMVQTQGSDRDPRAKAVTLTPSGRELATGSLRFRERMLAAATHTWQESDRETFADLLGEFADGVDRLPSPWNQTRKQR
ncbi:MAG: MarR family transcriptional regulator [Leifsonia sp.]